MAMFYGFKAARHAGRKSAAATCWMAARHFYDTYHAPTASGSRSAPSSRSSTPCCWRRPASDAERFAAQMTGRLAAAAREAGRPSPTRTRAEWCEIMDGTDVCFAPVLDLDEAPKHPHNAARETFVVRAAWCSPPGPALHRHPGRDRQPAPAARRAYRRDAAGCRLLRGRDRRAPRCPRHRLNAIPEEPHGHHPRHGQRPPDRPAHRLQRRPRDVPLPRCGASSTRMRAAPAAVGAATGSRPRGLAAGRRGGSLCPTLADDSAGPGAISATARSLIEEIALTELSPASVSAAFRHRRAVHLGPGDAGAEAPNGCRRRRRAR